MTISRLDEWFLMWHNCPVFCRRPCLVLYLSLAFISCGVLMFLMWFFWVTPVNKWLHLFQRWKNQLWTWLFSVWRCHCAPCCCCREKHAVLCLTYIPLHTDGHSLTAENQHHEEFFGSVLPAGTPSLGLCSTGNFSRFPTLRWQPCDCYGDLPVAAPQEATALVCNVEGWTLCTSELGSRVIGRVCIFWRRKKKYTQKLHIFVHVVQFLCKKNPNQCVFSVVTLP